MRGMKLQVCGVCGERIRRVVERYDTYWVSIDDGDSLSYVPSLHDHKPKGVSE